MMNIERWTLSVAVTAYMPHHFNRHRRHQCCHCFCRHNYHQMQNTHSHTHTYSIMPKPARKSRTRKKSFFLSYNACKNTFEKCISYQLAMEFDTATDLTSASVTVVQMYAGMNTFSWFVGLFFFSPPHRIRDLSLIRSNFHLSFNITFHFCLEWRKN